MKEHNYSIEEQKAVMDHFLKERRGPAVKEKAIGNRAAKENVTGNSVTKNVKVDILKLSKQAVSKMEI